MFTKLCFVLVSVTISVSFANGAAPKKAQEELPIKYPGPVQDHTENLLNRFEIPEECEGQSYCSIKPRDYPQEAFNKLVKGMKIMPSAQMLPDTVDNRQGEPEERDDCESKIEYEPIYKVLDENEKWRTVVQAPESNYIQRVRIQKCKDTKRSCFTVFPNTSDVKTACKQEFTTWELIVANEKDQTKSEMAKVLLPTCCSCKYRFVNQAALYGKP